MNQSVQPRNRDNNASRPSGKPMTTTRKSVIGLLVYEASQQGFPMANRAAWRLCNQSGAMLKIVKTVKKPGSRAVTTC